MAPNVTLRMNTADIAWHVICKIKDLFRLLDECNFLLKQEVWAVYWILFIHLYFIFYMCI